MSQILAFRTAFPEETWREIGSRCSPPIPPDQAIKYHKSALVRLGTDAGEVGEKLADEHRLAKIVLTEIDRVGQALKFRNVAEWIVDEFNDFTKKDRTKLVQSQPSQMMRVATQATANANLLEGLPGEITEVRDIAKMAEVRLKIIKEAERRGLLDQTKPVQIEEGV